MTIVRDVEISAPSARDELISVARAGMAAKAKEFRESGGELYLPVTVDS